MTREELTELLNLGESDRLDWKRVFPLGLTAARDDPQRDAGRGELLKDLAALANSPAEPPYFLVYGVHDNGTTRTVLGINEAFDDAMFQDLARGVLDPPPLFTYTEVGYPDGKVVAAFTIQASDGYPHVANRSIGPLHEGQVWTRRGTQNQVAGHFELRRMFWPVPLYLGNPHDPLIAEIEARYREQGDRLSWRRLDEKDTLLHQGWRLARNADTRQWITCGHDVHGNPDLVLMVWPRPEERTRS